ncbi:MAG: aspartate-semialdehyde dehydrogenase [Bacteroidales bacterium]|nr:aspartate-semialdehyde dehydrogenase [Bacteroidales bacterium]
MVNIAVIGATGLVGQEMLKVLEEFQLPVQNSLLCASEKSLGKKIYFLNKEHQVISIDEALRSKVHIAIFSAGSDVSKQYAPLFVQKGAFVVDNSSYWRLYAHVPLVVPEINADAINSETKIIANPNCSTIQMVVALAPLHRKYKIKRLVISTYQSVTGTGMKAVQQLMSERKGEVCNSVYPHPIDLNCFPHGGSFLPNGYTTEEQKLVDETRKILNDSSIKVTATVVRIPVIGGHSEAVNVEFEHDFNIEEVRQMLANTPGVVVLDEPNKNIYPTPRMAQGKNEVFVGRIRRDDSIEHGLNLWIVADNIRKGAATNAVQIAQYLYNKFFA